LLNITYIYDPAGNRIRKTAVEGEYNYAYNSLNQLVQEDDRIAPVSAKKITVSGTVSDKSFIDYVKVNGVKATLGNGTFTCDITLISGSNTITVVGADVLGNITTKSISVTYQPEVTAVTITYVYDANGNLVSKQEPAKTTSYGYDAENRLVSFSAPGLSEAYTYDGEGKRVKVTSNSVTTSFLYDGLSVALERGASGSTTASYVRNPLAPGGIGGIISSVAGAQTNYYHYDGIGTVTVLSNASGAQSQSYSYDAFGNVLAQSGTATNSRNFLTKETSSTGLVYFGARYYDPRVGRFISRDPSGMSDGPNVYTYCKNDPVNYVDLWGLCKDNGNSIDIDDLLYQLEDWSNAMMMNPVADGMPQIPLDQGLGLVGLDISKTGKTVLGHFPEYIQKAKQMGASYFDIGKNWSALSKAQQWATNQKFLNAIAKTGDQIYLSVSKTLIKAGSSLTKEIEYLTETKGYQWINQWSLKKNR